MQGRHRAFACVSWLLACCATSGDEPGAASDDEPATPADAREIATPIGAELAVSNLPRERPTLSDADAHTFAAGNARFALELYAEIARAQEPGENLFISPFSVSTALAMTYAGAEGETEREMRDTLHYDLDEPALHSAFNATTGALQARAHELSGNGRDADSTLSLVNQAWGARGYAFADAYLDVLAGQYGAGMFLLDFGEPEAARAVINGWVLDQTQQRIDELLPRDSLTANTRLVLTNAIYFKANWLSQFKPAMTTDGTFMTETGPRGVRMMHQVLDARDARYYETDAYRALELRYVSSNVRMLLVLPEQGDLDALIESLNDDLLAIVHGQLRGCATTLTLPKFSFESTHPLKVALSMLGMPSAFSSDANFSGITSEGEALYIGEVFHKAFVAVDEQGAEAAAATAVVVNGRLAHESTEIAFDRPFVFLIYDEPTGQVLFVGHLRDPG